MLLNVKNKNYKTIISPKNYPRDSSRKLKSYKQKLRYGTEEPHRQVEKYLTVPLKHPQK